MWGNFTGKGDLICPICGSITRTLVNGRCISCYLDILMDKIPLEIDIKVCKSCGRFEKSLDSIVKKYIGKTELPLECEIEFLDDENLKITLKYNKIKKEKNIRLIYDTYLCNNCYLSTASFYEAIIQIRGDNWKYVSDVVKFLIKNLEENKHKKFISQENTVKKGLDIRVMDKNIAEQVVKKIQNVYKLAYISKVTSKLRGIDRQTSKPILKFTYLLRTYDVNIGDIILYNNELYSIERIDKNSSTLKNITNGKNIKIPLDEIYNHGKKIDEENGILLYEDDKLAYISHNNEIIEALSIVDDVEPGDQVGFVKYNNKTYMVKKYGKKED